MKFNHNNLREARLRKNLTLEEMAKFMDMDISAFWRLETGKTKVKAEQLVFFMDFFDKPYSYFFEAGNSTRCITLLVECLPDNIQILYEFIKKHPGIVIDWEQKLLRLEQELT